jgi:hypothetical protein
MSGAVDKSGLNVLGIVKKTSLATVVVGAIALQIFVFRAVGDVLTSALLFGLGYFAAKMK